MIPHKSCILILYKEGKDCRQYQRPDVKTGLLRERGSTCVAEMSRVPAVLSQSNDQHSSLPQNWVVDPASAGLDLSATGVVGEGTKAKPAVTHGISMAQRELEDIEYRRGNRQLRNTRRYRQLSEGQHPQKPADNVLRKRMELLIANKITG